MNQVVYCRFVRKLPRILELDLVPQRSGDTLIAGKWDARRSADSNLAKEPPPGACATLVTEKTDRGRPSIYHQSSPVTPITERQGKCCGQLVSWGTKVTFVAHGDTRPEAIEGRIEGLDSLLLQGAIVNAVEMPDDEDLNSILAKHGPAEVIKLFGTAKRQTLSPKGEIERLARLDIADFELGLKTEAAKIGMTQTALRKVVETRRSQLRKAAKLAETSAGTGGIGSREEDDPWTGPINLRDALDDTYAAILRYVDTRKRTPLSARCGQQWRISSTSRLSSCKSARASFSTVCSPTAARPPSLPLSANSSPTVRCSRAIPEARSSASST